MVAVESVVLDPKRKRKRKGKRTDKAKRVRTDRLQVLVGVVEAMHDRLQVVEGRLQALVGVMQQLVAVQIKVNSLNGLGE